MPGQCSDEFFVVTQESAKISLEKTLDSGHEEFFSTLGDNEMNNSRVVPTKIFTSLFSNPLMDQYKKIGQVP